MQITWVDSESELKALVAQWQQQKAVAIDTEFMRERTFWPIPALLQIWMDETVWLVDIAAIEDCSSLAALMISGTRKVLHSPGEDLEVIAGLCGQMPAPLFDTQYAAALLGHDFQMSYQRLVKALLGVDIPKGETRSDWLQRPLTEAQVEYAALDVKYLLPLQELLARQLQEKSRFSWFEEDMTSVLRRAAIQTTPENYYRTIGNANQLTSVQLKVLQVLAQWREEQCRQRNIPRGFIARDAQLWNLAREMPGTLDAVKNIAGLSPGNARRYGKAFLELIDQVRREPGAFPDLPPVRALPREARSLMKACKKTVNQVAARLEVVPEVIGRKKWVEQLLLHRIYGETEIPFELEGWRKPLVTDPLLAVCNEFETDIQQWRKNG